MTEHACLLPLLTLCRLLHSLCHAQVIAIDEAQFFPDLVEFCKEAVDHDGKHVIVAGLSGVYGRGWLAIQQSCSKAGALFCRRCGGFIFCGWGTACKHIPIGMHALH